MDEAKIKEVLGDAIVELGRLRGLHGEALAFNPGDNAAYLDGDFTPEQLEAIAAHMRAHGGK